MSPVDTRTPTYTKGIIQLQHTYPCLWCWGRESILQSMEPYRSLRPNPDLGLTLSCTLLSLTPHLLSACPTHWTSSAYVYFPQETKKDLPACSSRIFSLWSYVSRSYLKKIICKEEPVGHDKLIFLLLLSWGQKKRSEIAYIRILFLETESMWKTG